MLVEAVTFRLADGTDGATFLQTDAQAYAAAMLREPRPLRRTTARDDDGGWLVLSLWSSPADACAAPPLLPDGVDTSTVEVRRWTALPG